MKFIHSGNEIKFYKVFSGNKLDGVICFKILISFDDDTEDTLLSILMYLQIASRYIYTRYQTLKSIVLALESQTNEVLSQLTEATLQRDVSYS